MKKRSIFIMMFIVILVNIDNESHVDVLNGDEAYHIYRIKDYNNIKYHIDESVTNKYYNHMNT